MKNRTKKIDQELAALAKMREEDIDTSDIPEITDWSGAVVGKFYRPIKEQVCLRLDADILDWFRRQGPGYQTRINDLLRNAMSSEVSSANRPSQAAHAPEVTARVAVKAACRSYRYPALERHGGLHECDTVAGEIAERHSLFALASSR